MSATTVARSVTRTAWVLIGILIAVTLVFAVRRVLDDVPHLAAGTAPEPQRYGAAYVAG